MVDQLLCTLGGVKQGAGSLLDCPAPPGRSLAPEEALALAMTEAAAAAASDGHDGDGGNNVMVSETREAGHVRWRVYRTYGDSVGRWTIALVLVSLLLMQVNCLLIMWGCSL